MLTVVCFRWGQKYTAEHVNRLASMVRRHYRAPLRMICVTNESQGIDPGVEIVPDRADFAGIQSPHGRAAPSCYRRLRLFAPDAAETFGERIVSLDLDTVIVGDMAPLWDRPGDFIGWQDPLSPRQLCGSMFVLRTGSRPHVWTGFNPLRSPSLAKAAGFNGSDQAWLTYALPSAATWTRDDGVLSHREAQGDDLPQGARVVFFHGRTKQWDPAPQSRAWVRENWR